MSDKTDVNIAELVARFERAVIDCVRLCDGHDLKLSDKELTESLSRAWQEADVKRKEYRLELLQVLSKKEAAE